MFLSFLPLAIITRITDEDVRKKAKELGLELSEAQIRQFVEDQKLPAEKIKEKDVRARAKELGLSLTDVQVALHVEKQTLPEKPAPAPKEPEYEVQKDVPVDKSEELQAKGWQVTKIYHLSGKLYHELRKPKG